MFQSLSPTLPLVVASVNSPDDLPAAAAARPGVDADVMEWRLDGLQSLPAAALADAMAACPLPAILTARRADEGGFAPWPDEAARRAAIDAHRAPGRWVDIEARSLEESGEWRAATCRWQDAGMGLIVSWHDFAGVPGDDSLTRAAAIAHACGADVLKVAGTADAIDGVCALAPVFKLAAPCAASVMAMGKFGRVSRLLFATAGSVLNYGFLRQASVPGQWPASSLLQALKDGGLR